MHFILVFLSVVNLSPEKKKVVAEGKESLLQSLAGWR